MALVRQELYFNAVQLAVPFPQRSYGVLVQLVNKEQAIRSSYLQSRGFKDRWSRNFLPHTVLETDDIWVEHSSVFKDVPGNFKY